MNNNLSKVNKTVLVVDDEPVISDLFKTLFELEGFVCFTANDVPTAMMLIMKIKPDLILSDIMMPEIDGFDFRKQVLENKELSNIPFVFLTSKDEEEYILNGYDLSIEDYILKSTNPTILLKKIETIFTSAAKTEKSTIGELSNAAKEISSELMPESSPELKGFEISQIHNPYNGIPGGDFVDYIKLNDDLLAIIVCDVMGKKWNAWFITFAYISYIRSAFRYEVENSNSPDPSRILQSVNKLILSDTKLANFFISASLVMVDRKRNKISYSGAGDLPMIQKPGNSDTILHKSSGINLGITENGDYSTRELDIVKGDTFFIYTDGVTEAANHNDELFGIKGLELLLKTNDDIGLQKIHDTVNAFSGNHFDDDLTMVSIKCL